MTTLGERIKWIRTESKETQEVFSKKISIKRNTLAMIESQNKNTSDLVISAICREYNVNENWLRTGEGEPFRKLDRAEELSSIFGNLMKSEPDVRHRLIAAISRCDIEELRMLERVATRWVEEMKKADP